jgi:hypothetical protein
MTISSELTEKLLGSFSEMIPLPTAWERLLEDDP